MSKRAQVASPSTGPDVVLRPRRQITLPAWVTESLGVEVGDHLTASVVNGTLTLRPNRRAALDALEEIRAAFAEAGITEEELQAEGRRVRAEITEERKRSSHAAR